MRNIHFPKLQGRIPGTRQNAREPKRALSEETDETTTKNGDGGWKIGFAIRRVEVKCDWLGSDV